MCTCSVVQRKLRVRSFVGAAVSVSALYVYQKVGFSVSRVSHDGSLELVCF